MNSPLSGNSPSHRKQARPAGQSPRLAAFRVLSGMDAAETLDQALRHLDEHLTEPRDRHLARELVLGCLRWQLRLDHIAAAYTRKPVASLSTESLTLLRLGLYQLLWLDGVPDHAAIHTTVELAKQVTRASLAGMVNAVLRRAQREPQRVVYPDRDQDAAAYLSLWYSHPRWLVERWLTRWGPERTEALLAANNRPAPLFIAANTQRTTRDQLVAALEAASVSVSPCQDAPEYLRVDHPERLFASQEYRDGLFFVQDIHASLAVKLLTPVPGRRILDLCSAPGGKTVQLALAVRNSSPVYAADLSRQRLSRVVHNRNRLALDCIIPIVQNAYRPCLPAATFDHVLADVPCSGTGTMGRRPDIRWRRTAAQLPKLARRQLRILESAFTLTSPGGILVYSTCSIESEENEMVIERFLTRNPDAELDCASAFFPSRSWAGRYIQTLPGDDPGDGSFAARIRKRAS